MITLKNVTKIFENKGIERVTALRNVNLTLEDKGMVFLSGFSGAGKSTLLSIIGGLDVPTSGNVIIDNFSLKNLSCIELDRYRNNYVGFVFENVNLINNMNVEENMKVSCAFNGNEPSQNQIEYIIDKLKLGQIRDRKPSQLSMGQRQKVGVGRALLKDPYLYLADDPTGHVDATRGDEIWAILKDISKKRLVIAVSHDARIINKYADRIITIDEGEIVSDKSNDSTDVTKPKETVTGAISELSVAKSAQEIITQKHRFSFKNLMKLAKNNLCYKKSRMAIIVLLTTLSLMFFSTFTIMNNFDREQVLAKSVTQNNMDYVTFVKTDGSGVTNVEYNGLVNYYKAETSYSTEFTSNKLIQYESAWLSTAGTSKQFSVSYLVKQADSSGTQTCLGQSILYGKKPSTELEWMVSDYVAKQIQLACELTSMEDVLGRTMSVTAKNIVTNPAIKIVGIYDTDYEKYMDKNTLVSKKYKEYELEYNLEHIYNVGLVSSEYINKVISVNNNKAKFDIVGVGANSDTVEVANSSTVCKTQSSDAANVYIDGIGSATSLAGNGSTPGVVLSSGDGDLASQVIVPLSFFNNLFSSEFKTSVGVELTQEYLNDNGFITSKILKTGTLPAVRLSFDGKNEKLYKIAGITETSEFIISDEDFNTVFTGLNLTTVGVIIKASASESLMQNIIETLEDDGYSFTSTTSSKINMFNNNISIFRTVFLVGSIFFGLFAMVLLYFFVYTLISDRKRDISILRTFGARARDIIKIFLISGFMIKLAVFAFATVGTLLVTWLGNLYAQSALGSVFSVFNVSVWDFVAMCAICLVTILVGTSIPIYNYAKKGPYENLRDSDG